MAPSVRALARAQCDADDQLVSAEEPLAGLQLRCGGMLPGVIAVPALRELVGKARQFGLKLARQILAQDGEEQIRAWVEVVPGEEHGGCTIALLSWHATPLPAGEANAAIRRRADVDQALAELTARLDGRQNLLSVECDAADLADLAARMRAGLGRPWTDFVTLPGNAYHQPLHWRLLDGAPLEIEGSNRGWRASLLPQTGPGAEPEGFELCLTAQVPANAGQGAERAAEAGPRHAVVGREIAPVLRQPMARIVAHAETVRLRMAGPLADEYAAYAADIATAGQHLLALVDDLADLEVIESASFATAADPIDLADVARRAAGILAVRAREKRIELVAPAAEASVPAVAEFRRVLQILLNLIGNAIRYSPEGSQVTVAVEAGEGGRARAMVSDQGPGLAPDEQPRVFAKFERLGRSGDGGSGLGLYISRRLARAMGGDLSVDSAKGAGARFTLDVPGG